ncbi:tRNA (adenine(22)-N(1))-methyltransferase [Anaerotignum sp. MB30-C6]|uniref:tRNA (adenine(22)-N(1))-methyltransferase n=1 Tax=Anaerotignum sp. MB30-C6 TaxID=3070814 RepID=UPI0027DD63EC|nr:class I SAM-dependent methyltransferase [Anaerotignum sp. MB30-C6]WMI81295.1 class I SAM-dependent methyltransferase [Anaerotignum sp. MB30-C6]
MEISKRLQAVAALVSYPNVADVGTDHGYVPIYLHRKGKLKRAFACDVRKGPLEKAKENIRLFQAEHDIETRLGSGLLPLQVGEADTAVIAGMGGMLTVRILKDSPAVVASLKELILAPQHDVDVVRRYLHEIGFSIETELMMQEDGKTYHIMRCIPGEEKYPREIDYLYGKKLLEQKEPLLKELLTIEEEKYRLVEQKLVKSNTESAKERLVQVREKLSFMREALACL